MFPHKSLLYVYTVALTTSSPQSYFHNFGNQGTYTSVNHGSTTGLHHQPAPAAYNPPAAAAYSPTAPVAYKRPAPVYAQPGYHAPPQPHAHPKPHAHPQHHALPQPHAHPRPHGPGIEYDREKCAVDYVEKKAEVCVPTFKTDCERE